MQCQFRAHYLKSSSSKAGSDLHSLKQHRSLNKSVSKKDRSITARLPPTSPSIETTNLRIVTEMVGSLCEIRREKGLFVILKTRIYFWHSTVHPTTLACHLTELPAEIHLKVFDLLDLNSSTCLGLTCKKLYPIHRALHGVVPLNPY